MKQRGKKKKRIKRNEDNFRDIWDNVKCLNIQIIGVPEKEDKKKGHEKILEEIIVENFPKMGKEIATQIQDTWRVPNRIIQGKTPQDNHHPPSQKSRKRSFPIGQRVFRFRKSQRELGVRNSNHQIIR